MMKLFLIALQFLTRINLKVLPAVTDDEFAASTRMYPLVGAVIGLILSLGFLLLRQGDFFSPLFTGAALVTLEIMITGGLHLDGLMDSADGLFSYRPAGQILEIMKDSRVGANAVLAALCLILLKAGLLSSMRTPAQALLLILMTVCGRWVALYLAANFQHAGAQGSLGRKVIGASGKSEYLFALVTTVLLIFLLALLEKVFTCGSLIYFLTTFLGIFAVSTLLARRFARYVTAKIGGITGDITGAAVEVTELVVLFLGLLALGSGGLN